MWFMISAHVVNLQVWYFVSKFPEPLGGSLTYQVLKMNTVHAQARLEFQLSEGRVNQLGRSG